MIVPNDDGAVDSLTPDQTLEAIKSGVALEYSFGDKIWRDLKHPKTLRVEDILEMCFRYKQVRMNDRAIPNVSRNTNARHVVYTVSLSTRKVVQLSRPHGGGVYWDTPEEAYVALVVLLSVFNLEPSDDQPYRRG